MIVFDGLYSFVSIGLSSLALLALRFVRRGPDDRYPWGREAAEPLVVILKAATLGALCVYAAVGAIDDLLRGGRQVEVGWAVVYALIATAASLIIGLVLRRGVRSPSPEGPGTDVVRAEAAEWLGDALLSAGVPAALDLDAAGCRFRRGLGHPDLQDAILVRRRDDLR
jgi:predicted Co/Zn/Cd cation transporter (cation efflux family)